MRPLLMIDLDNTLIDRDAAFREACAAFLSAHGLPAADLDALMEADASGYTPREPLSRWLAERYGSRAPADGVRALLDGGGADRTVLAPATREALLRATAAGWRCVIVTNGETEQQEAKIRHTGLDALVHGWVISEAAGHKKPAPQIFHAAAAVAGADSGAGAGAGAGPAEAWMVGDSAAADIGGAHGLGIRSVWVSPTAAAWPEPGFRPTHTAPDAASAITYVLAAGPVGGGTARTI
ncbi:HAD family hydrolase [Streptomyces sp. NBC_00503]|uniref:HAD family hydrolase n=1 Tax=Streptomyces sp. NBC_00503 TaxID=2903659 RepID=UPI002E81AFD6|nr:HAD family hydrolase [Streptomyces sp. NBC_00503]WUD82670.1 HAD family hydrolase [Streptomyces sp. NBC_00503]